MTSIGESLRQERLRRDLGVEQISRELKIAPRFLEAIEEERFERLPGGVFAKSFVRQYARYLGLDEDEYAAAVQQAVEPRLTSSSPAGPAIPPVDIALPRVEEWQSVGSRRFQWSSSLPALAMVVIAMLVCSGVYTWWQRHRLTTVNAEKQRVSESVSAAQPPAAQAQTPPAVPSAPPATSSTEVAAAAVPPVATGTPSPQPATSPASSANRPVSDMATPAPAAQANTSTAAGAVKVEISATEPVWVLARADGKYAFSGTLEANQSRVVEANQTLTIRLGNAGGANITLNGKPIGPVGPKGEVRTVQFTSGGFQIVAAPKPSAPPSDPLL